MSPSGRPKLQVNKVWFTVNMIVLPVIKSKTLLFPTDDPKFIHDGKDIFDSESHTKNVESPNLDNTGKFIVTNELQYANDVEPKIVSSGKLTEVKDGFLQKQ